MRYLEIATEENELSRIRVFMMQHEQPIVAF